MTGDQEKLEGFIEHVTSRKCRVEVLIRNFVPAYITRLETTTDVLKNQLAVNVFHRKFELPMAPRSDEPGTARLDETWNLAPKAVVRGFVQVHQQWFMVLENARLPKNQEAWPLAGGMYPTNLKVTFDLSGRHVHDVGLVKGVDRLQSSTLESPATYARLASTSVAKALVIPSGGGASLVGIVVDKTLCPMATMYLRAETAAVISALRHSFCRDRFVSHPGLPLHVLWGVVGDIVVLQRRGWLCSVVGGK
ncbi:unnamed protein product, partial [Cladocopium goreaui]